MCCKKKNNNNNRPIPARNPDLISRKSTCHLGDFAVWVHHRVSGGWSQIVGSCESTEAVKYEFDGDRIVIGSLETISKNLEKRLG